MARTPKEKVSAKEKATFTTFVDPEKYRLIRLLSVQTDREINDLIDEALDLLLSKHAENIPRLPNQS